MQRGAERLRARGVVEAAGGPWCRRTGPGKPPAAGGAGGHPPRDQRLCTGPRSVSFPGSGTRTGKTACEQGYSPTPTSSCGGAGVGGCSRDGWVRNERRKERRCMRGKQNLSATKNPEGHTPNTKSLYTIPEDVWLFFSPLGVHTTFHKL